MIHFSDIADILGSVATHFVTLIGGMIGGAVLHAFVWPPIERRISSIKASWARERLRKSQLPDPPRGFPMYVRGNMQLPVMSLFGTPSEPVSMGDITIAFNPMSTTQSDDYPQALRDAIKPLLTEYLKKRSNKIVDNPMPRFLGISQGGERENDTRGELTLQLGLTSYFEYCATNCSLDVSIIPKRGLRGWFTNNTLREAYMPEPYVADGSPFANPLSSHCIVISRNNSQSPPVQVLVRRRSQKVALYRGYYQSSAAGYVVLAHRDYNDRPSPFVAAAAEANQEISDRLKAKPEDFRLIGIAVNWGELDINAFGYVETGLSVEELVGDTSRDSYEGTTEAITFTPSAVFAHFASHKWEAMGAMALCQTLLAFFSDEEVDSAARRMPAKGWRDFCDVPIYDA